MWSHEKNSLQGLTTSAPTLPESVLFVSDVHLGGFSEKDNAKIEHDFIELLNWCMENNTTIVLLGDIFDYFMQYDTYLPEVCGRTLDWFTSYHQKHNRSTLFITGNHDNWDFGALRDAGFDTEKEFRIFRTNQNHIVMLMHGDGLVDPTFSFPRPLFHRFLRNTYFIKLFQAFTTGKSGNTIMRNFSIWSRKHDDGSNLDKLHLDSNALRILQNYPIDTIICGHHHEVRDIRTQNKRYINSGAFFSDRSACLYTNGSFDLVKWDGLHKTLSKLI